MQIVWTRPAVRDLGAARSYIVLENPAAADRQIGLVLASVANLLRFPEIGRPGRVAGTRELVVSQTPYVVAYRLAGDTIQVLRVLHGRQRWPAAV